MTIEERLDRIEKIMKDREMHEPTCRVRQTQQHNALGQTFMTSDGCNCWILWESDQ